MNYLKSALLLFSASIGFSIVADAETLEVIQQKDKFGYTDGSGKIVIKAQFDKAFPFEDNRAKVCKGDKWGYINTQGKPVIAIQYDNIENFENGIARVKKGKKYGYIKEDGSVYIKPDYNFIGSPNADGYIWVGKGKSFEAALFGLYHNGKLILQPKYAWLGFYQTTDSIDYASGSPVSNVNGRPKANEINSNFCRLSVSEHPYIWAQTAAGFNQIFDTSGKAVIKLQKGAIGMPREGYVIRRRYSKSKDKEYYDYNYISTDGKSAQLFKKDIRQLIDSDNIYEGCMPFRNGYAMCTSEDFSYLINTAGNSVSPFYSMLQVVKDHGYITKKDNRYGLLSPTGKEILAPTYKKLSAANSEGTSFIAQESATSLFGFIDNTGQEIIPFKYADATAMINGNAYVKEGLYYGVIDLQGNYIVKNRWERILPAPTGEFVWVKSPETDKWHTLRMSSDSLAFAEGYGQVSAYDEKGRALVMDGGNFGAVGTDNSIVLPFRFNNVSVAQKAIRKLDAEGKDHMTDIEAYRFNIYNNPGIHKYHLHQAIPSNMWDF